MPAGAGGPTSVLLVAPGSGGTASLYYDDPDYAELSRLVGIGGDSGTQARGSHETGRSITVTWLAHDVQVWRVDRIFLGGPDGPWVASHTGLDENLWDGPLAWYRPAEPAALLGLLDRLGVEPGSRTGGTPIPDQEIQPSARPVTNPQASVAPPVAAAATGTPWLLLALAAAGGALAAAAVTLLLARRWSGGAAPADPVVAGSEGEPDWSPVEQLAHR